MYERTVWPVRESVGGSRPIPRSDTAATLNRIIVTAPISPKKTRWRSTSTLTAGFFLRSVIVVFVLPLGQQHSSMRIAVVTPTPQLQVEELRRPAAHDERGTGDQTYNCKCRRFRNSRKNLPLELHRPPNTARTWSNRPSIPSSVGNETLRRPGRPAHRTVPRMPRACRLAAA